MGWEDRLAGDKQPQTFNNVSLTPPSPAHTAQTNDQTKSQETWNFKQSFNCSHWDKVRRPPSARGCGKQTEKCNSSWVVAQTGSRGAAVACWELEAMAALGPGGWAVAGGKGPQWVERWTCSREETTLPSWTSSIMVRTWRVVTVPAGGGGGIHTEPQAGGPP